MAKSSSQKFIARNRAPRVQIEYDVELYGAEKKVQLPFVMASNYEIEIDVTNRIPREFLFKHMIVPLDIFDDVVTLVMPILTPFEVLNKIQNEHTCEVFPYVGLISENKKVLSELYDDFKDWLTKDKSNKEQRKQQGPRDAGGDWMNMFDDADAKVRDGLG